MTESILQRIIDDLSNCSNIRLNYDSDKLQWKAEFEYYRCTFGGVGDTPEEALIEAAVDKEISDYYYCASMEGPELTQDEMNMRLRDKYRLYLDKHPEHEYRGDYIKDPSIFAKNPRQAANEVILKMIKDFVERYPDMRFWQILMNMDVLDYRMEDGVFYCKDPWNEESASTLRRMRKRL